LFEEMAGVVITIDGPAASGKSTVARLLALRLGADFLDTGAMYRAATLAAMRAGIDMENEDELLRIIESSDFQFSTDRDKTIVRLDGVDVTDEIRRQDVTANARYAASAPKVRARLVLKQRRMAAEKEKIVTEGRDQGTVAFPDANIKFFLTADAKTRAERRRAEMPDADAGQDIEQVRRAIEARDKSDRDREVGPLRPADDAIIVDTTELTIDQVVRTLLGYVEDRY
jgi:cytidylate kinase